VMLLLPSALAIGGVTMIVNGLRRQKAANAAKS
jgi:hypothetical protein